MMNITGIHNQHLFNKSLKDFTIAECSMTLETPSGGATSMSCYDRNDDGFEHKLLPELLEEITQYSLLDR